MRRAFGFVFATVVALLSPSAFAQTPTSSMPAGTQNPALVQPQPVAPRPVQLVPPAPQLVAPQPAGPQPGSPQPGGPTPDSPSAGILMVPGGAGGFCECLINHDAGLSVFDKTKMHQACLANVEACQAVCNTQRFFSFIPNAVYTCPGRRDEPGHVAMNTRPAARLLTAAR